MRAVGYGILCCGVWGLESDIHSAMCFHALDEELITSCYRCVLWSREHVTLILLSLGSFFFSLGIWDNGYSWLVGLWSSSLLAVKASESKTSGRKKYYYYKTEVHINCMYWILLLPRDCEFFCIYVCMCSDDNFTYIFEQKKKLQRRSLELILVGIDIGLLGSEILTSTLKLRFTYASFTG